MYTFRVAADVGTSGPLHDSVYSRPHHSLVVRGRGTGDSGVVGRVILTRGRQWSVRGKDRVEGVGMVLSSWEGRGVFVGSTHPTVRRPLGPNY